jgi:hypothetical protein
MKDGNEKPADCTASRTRLPDEIADHRIKYISEQPGFYGR